jgi:hypothetical protein
MTIRGAVASAAVVAMLAIALSAARGFRVANGDAVGVATTNPMDVDVERDVSALRDNASFVDAANAPADSVVERRPDAPDRARVFRNPPVAGTAEPIAISADVATSLADAMRDGDDRAPPIARDAGRVVAPSPAELADPRAYRRLESRRQAQLYASFEREAVIALGDMRRDLQRARAEHVSPELIAEGEDKARRLAETLEALRRRELDASR